MAEPNWSEPRSFPPRMGLSLMAIILGALGVAILFSQEKGPIPRPPIEGVISENGAVTLLDFWAPWCAPCLTMGQILETEVAPQLSGIARIHKINIDENGALAEEFGVSAIPTLVIMKGGAEVQRFRGVQNSKTLLAAILKHAQSDEESAE